MAAITLYDHQLAALKDISNGCILCGGVGSGKSITAIAWYYLQNGGSIMSLQGDEYVPMDDPPKDLYIITTARKRDTKEWEGELIPFLLYPGQPNLYSNKVVIDSWNNIKKYIGITNAIFIFDEQRVVGYGEWTKSFLKITKNNQWIMLSATPGDTWSDYIPVFIANGFYKNKTEFNSEHVIFKPFSKFPQIDRYINVQRLIRLRNRVLVDMDFNRATTRHSISVKCSYNIDIYKSITKDRWNPYTKSPIMNVSELCSVWRRCANEDPSRSAQILDICNHRDKVIIFYNFDYELDILRTLPYANGTEVAEWNGHKHQEIPSSKKWVYLVQYTAGAEGWNCIKTDTIIFYSQTYSYRTLEQSMGRIDRLNTPYRDLYYYHLRSMAPIDIAISRALKNKKKFNETRYVSSMTTLKGVTNYAKVSS
uniref:Chromatin remodeling complex ATPase n=1 Tax=Siphoviridae sp. ctWT735 TaxID=2825538 RepID=A0A8S5TU36_9CAUD|nr:MAG TPA: Chromatin remodeling complex ATPase [Siphoviridae sp. ctWT735]